MHGKKLVRAVAFMTVVPMLCGLFGCKKTSEYARYGISELTAVSAAYGCADRSAGYSFTVRLDDGVWLFDAECFVSDAEVSVNGRELSAEEAEEMLRILRDNDSIAYAQRYKKPSGVLGVSDGDAYSFALTFSDGKQYVTGDRQSGLEGLFYRLAEKYRNTNQINETEK